jgi:hypothetical protein
MACMSVALHDPRLEHLSRLVMQTFSHTPAIEHVGSWHKADTYGAGERVRS